MVFSTKNRALFLDSQDLSREVFQHLKQNSEEKDIWLDCVNGHQDHAHCLLFLGKEQTISKVVQLIKGESSYWINKNKLTKDKFSWQDDYWVVGVSESDLESVRKYIHNQEEHHSKRLFNDEINEFMERYGWNLIKNDAKAK